MKKLILLPVMLLCGTLSYGQCNQDVVMTSSKTEYLDASGAVQRSVDENSTVEISKTKVLISPGSGNQMNGTVTSVTCDWGTPYKEGLSVIKAEFTNPEGQMMHAKITIEGKDGKQTFLMQVEEMPNLKIRVPLDSFEVKK